MRHFPARIVIALVFCLALALAQVRDSLRPSFAAEVEIVTRDTATGRSVPARVYLFKNNAPFRFGGVESLIAFRSDLFYRDTLWQRVPRPKTLEVTARDESHFFLLEGSAF